MKKKHVILISCVAAIGVPVIVGVSTSLAISQAGRYVKPTISDSLRVQREAQISNFVHRSNIAIQFVPSNEIASASSVLNTDSRLTNKNFSITNDLSSTQNEQWSFVVKSFDVAGIDSVIVNYVVTHKFDPNEPAVSKEFQIKFTGFKIDDDQIIAKIINDKPKILWNTEDGNPPEIRDFNQITINDFLLPKPIANETYKLEILPRNMNRPTELILKVTVSSKEKSGSYQYVVTGIFDPVSARINQYFTIVGNVPRIILKAEKGILINSLPSIFANYTNAQLLETFDLVFPNPTREIAITIDDNKLQIPFESSIKDIVRVSNETGEVILSVSISSPTNQFKAIDLNVTVNGFLDINQLDLIRLRNIIKLTKEIQDLLVAYNTIQPTPDFHGLIASRFFSFDEKLIYSSNDVASFIERYRDLILNVQLDIKKVTLELANIFKLVNTVPALQGRISGDLLIFFNPTTAEGRANLAYTKNYGFRIRKADMIQGNPTTARVQIDILDFANNTASELIKAELDNTPLIIDMYNFLTTDQFVINTALSNIEENFTPLYNQQLFNRLSQIEPNQLVDRINSGGTTIEKRLEELNKLFTFSQPPFFNRKRVNYEFVAKPTISEDGSVSFTNDTATVAEANNGNGAVDLYVKVTLVDESDPSVKKDVYKPAKYFTYQVVGLISSLNKTNNKIIEAVNKNLVPTYRRTNLQFGSDKFINETAPDDVRTANFEITINDMQKANIDPQNVSLVVKDVIPFGSDADITGKVEVTIEVSSVDKTGIVQTYKVIVSGFKSTYTDNLKAITEEVSKIDAATLDPEFAQILPNNLSASNFSLTSPNGSNLEDQNTKITYKVVDITKTTLNRPNDVLGTLQLQIEATRGEGAGKATYHFAQQISNLWTVEQLLNHKIDTVENILESVLINTYLPSEFLNLSFDETNKESVVGTLKNNIYGILTLSQDALKNSQSLKINYRLVPTSQRAPIPVDGVKITNLNESIRDVNDNDGTFTAYIYLWVSTLSEENGVAQTVNSKPFQVKLSPTQGILSYEKVLEEWMKANVNASLIQAIEHSGTKLQQINRNLVPLDVVVLESTEFNYVSLKLDLSAFGTSASTITLSSRSGKTIPVNPSFVIKEIKVNEGNTNNGKVVIQGSLSAATFDLTLDLEGFMSISDALELANDNLLKGIVIPNFTDDQGSTTNNSKIPETLVSNLTTENFVFKDVSGIRYDSETGKYFDRNNVEYRIDGVSTTKENRDAGETTLAIRIEKSGQPMLVNITIKGFKKG